MSRNAFTGAGVCVLALIGWFGCSSDESSDSNGDVDSGSTGGSTGSGGGSATGGSDGSGGGSAGSGGSTGGSGGGSNADSGTPDGGGSILFEGSVVEATPGDLGSAEPPLEGVEICVVDDEGMTVTDVECETTGADGAFSLGPLEANQQIIVAFSKDGYLTQVKPVDVAGATITLPTAFRLAATGDAGVMNFGWDPAVVPDTSMGSVNFFAVMVHVGDGGGDTGNGFDWVPDVSVTIEPDDGEGPFYIDADETFRTGATATGEGGYGGWFMNLAPGEHVLTFSHPTLNCAPIAGAAFGWPEGDHSVRTPILANVNVQAVGVFCSEPVDAGP